MLESSVAAACIHPLSCSNLFDIMLVILSNSHTLQTKFYCLTENNGSFATECTVDDHQDAGKEKNKLGYSDRFQDIGYSFACYLVIIQSHVIMTF